MPEYLHSSAHWQMYPPSRWQSLSESRCHCNGFSCSRFRHFYHKPYKNCRLALAVSAVESKPRQQRLHALLRNGLRPPGKVFPDSYQSYKSSYPDHLQMSSHFHSAPDISDTQTRHLTLPCHHTQSLQSTDSSPCKKYHSYIQVHFRGFGNWSAVQSWHSDCPYRYMYCTYP